MQIGEGKDKKPATVQRGRDAGRGRQKPRRGGRSGSPARKQWLLASRAPEGADRAHSFLCHGHMELVPTRQIVPECPVSGFPPSPGDKPKSQEGQEDTHGSLGHVKPRAEHLEPCSPARAQRCKKQVGFQRSRPQQLLPWGAGPLPHWVTEPLSELAFPCWPRIREAARLLLIKGLSRVPRSFP